MRLFRLPKAAGAKIGRMIRYTVPTGVALRHWDAEQTALAHVQGDGTTHLIGIAALALIQEASGHAQGLSLREIAHALGVDGEIDAEVEASLQRIIDGLIQSGLLHRVDADAEPGPDSPP